MPPAKSTAASSISVTRLACCADDSYDKGSCRIRLPPDVWAAAKIPYHKPVIVSIPCEGSSQPWRLLCVAALAADELGHSASLPGQQHTPLRSPPPAQQRQPSVPSRPTADLAVVDPSVVVVPPGRTLAELGAALERSGKLGATAGAACPEDEQEGSTGACVEVTPCRGAGVSAAAEVQLLVPPGQEHLASPVMSFKLHQALVLPGCVLRVSDSCALQVVSVRPAPAGPDQPLRIVPSTRITALSASQQQQQQQQQQEAVGEGLPRQPQQLPEEAREQQQPQGQQRRLGLVAGDGSAAEAAGEGDTAASRERGPESRQPAEGLGQEAGAAEASSSCRAGGGSSEAAAGAKAKPKGGSKGSSGKGSGKAGKCGSAEAGPEAGGESAYVSGSAADPDPDGGTSGGTSGRAARGGDGGSGEPRAEAKARRKTKPAEAVPGGDADVPGTGSVPGTAGEGGGAGEAPGRKAKAKPKARKSKGAGGGLTASASAFDALLGLDEDA